MVVAGAVLWWGSGVVSDTWRPDPNAGTDRALAQESLATAIADVEQASNLFDNKVRSSDVVRTYQTAGKT